MHSSRPDVDGSASRPRMARWAKEQSARSRTLPRTPRGHPWAPSLTQQPVACDSERRVRTASDPGVLLRRRGHVRTGQLTRNEPRPGRRPGADPVDPEAAPVVTVEAVGHQIPAPADMDQPVGFDPPPDPDLVLVAVVHAQLHGQYLARVTAADVQAEVRDGRGGRCPGRRDADRPSGTRTPANVPARSASTAGVARSRPLCPCNDPGPRSRRTTRRPRP